jgi:D-serine deaminase-like pyridoxal phosphate-dependent protein
MVDHAGWRELDTPAALVDVDRMEANLRTTVEYCSRWNLAFRPHAKTHKSTYVARRQLELGATGVTVATLGEAEVLARVADDVLLAYPPVGPHRLRRLALLPDRVKLSVALDSAEVFLPLASTARDHGRPIDVLVEVDVGLRRVGVQSLAGVMDLARLIVETPGVRYRGLMLYPGHIRMPVPDQGPALAELSDQVAHLLGELEKADLAPEVVSGGSTPTLFRSHEIAGVSEIRPGTGIFNDRTTALLGACEWTDCAYTVLARVVSTTIPGQAVIDAGSKSLAKETVNATLPNPDMARGYGCVLDQPELVVQALSEEHGVINLEGSSWRPSLGELVRIVPNHVCVSVNLAERLWQVQEDRVLGSWEVEARGR